MPKCPQGHDSTTDDFCDVCGEPIAGGDNPASKPSTPVAAPPAAAAPAAPKNSLSLDPAPAAPAAPPVPCPNCGEDNLADAMFCEVCGYDFTTGQLPTTPATVAAATPVEWVAELWVDPDWFAAQEAAGTSPTSGQPTVIPLPGTRAAIGRASKSRGLAPQIDCSVDGSVSHKHAELTLNGDRWSIEDLGSTNGTYIGATGDALPSTPITPHQRRELADNERIYLGAFCRIMIRKATDDEK
ncbi:MAG TPA: FHA domain-containing protein [Acidimicrobiia bacterium]|nr:FHA domain-containing protein [Acidimicrobiia bacterium]